MWLIWHFKFQKCFKIFFHMKYTNIYLEINKHEMLVFQENCTIIYLKALYKHIISHIVKKVIILTKHSFLACLSKCKYNIKYNKNVALNQIKELHLYCHLENIKNSDPTISVTSLFYSVWQKYLRFPPKLLWRPTETGE